MAQKNRNQNEELIDFEEPKSKGILNEFPLEPLSLQ